MLSSKATLKTYRVTVSSSDISFSYFTKEYSRDAAHSQSLYDMEQWSTMLGKKLEVEIKVLK